MSKNQPGTVWPHDPELEALELLSNSVVDLIKLGRLDDAERACLELKRRYPDMIDWIERTGALHEARGDVRQAVDHYRQCIDFIDNDPDGFDTDGKDYFRGKIERLQSRRER